MTFYNQNISTPLSQVHGSSPAVWDNSQIGSLFNQTNKQIFIREVPPSQRSEMLCWRIVDAQWSAEDSTMTTFRAFDYNSQALPFATFGVRWDGSPHQIGGGFKYPPEFGRGYYVPRNNDFMTPNAGGYSVCVLDTAYPTEHLDFGMFKQGENHSCLVVSFRLMDLGPKYPGE